MANIYDVGFIIACVKTDSLVFLITFKKVGEGLIQFLLDFCRSFSDFFKNVSHGLKNNFADGSCKRCYVKKKRTVLSVFFNFRNDKLGHNKYSKKGAMSVRCVEDYSSEVRCLENEYGDGCGWPYDYFVYAYLVGNLILNRVGFIFMYEKFLEIALVNFLKKNAY